MSDLSHRIDECMRPAAASKLEILLFTLGADPRSGRTETYAINAFKVCEVMRAPQIARAPDTDPAVAGMISLRGALVPVIDLAKYAGLPGGAQAGIMIVTEYDGRTQGFLVAAVDKILSLDRARLKAPPDMLARGGRDSITAVAEHGDGRLIMMIDVEKVLADTAGGAPAETCADSLAPLGLSDRTVLFADDSAVARKQIAPMEILLFSVGGTETFGINVLKVREVTLTPRITRTPNVAAGVQGVICLRGNIIPVIDLARFVGSDCDAGDRARTLLVTEICGRTQAFLAAGVDGIVRVEWDHVKTPNAALVGGDGPVTALTRLADGRMVSILDVEQILARAFGEPGVPDFEPLADGHDPRLLFADDSPVARRAIARVLDKLGVRYHQATNGEEAWQKLQTMAAQAQSEGAQLCDRLRVILTDAEMPQMDGYLLARLVRSDRRFDGVPVVMHTALSPRAASAMGPGADVDAYVSKFNPAGLADALRPMLRDRFRSTALN